MKKRIHFFLSALLVIQTTAALCSDPEITATDLKQHVYFLADDSLQGRKPGSAGSKLAAEYVLENFKNNKMRLVGQQGLQLFDVVTSIQAGEKTSLTVDTLRGVLHTNFTPLAFSENKTISAKAAFVGYGLDFETDSTSWHDYTGIDVTGRWVLLLLGDPDMDNAASVFSQHSQLRHKVMKARDHGAAGVIFVAGEQYDKSDVLLDLTFDMSESTAGLPVVQVKRTIGDYLLQHSGSSVNDLEKLINETKQPHSFIIEKTVTAAIEIVRRYEKAANVVAFIEGSDAILKNEYIIVGAHFDHLGYGGFGSGSRMPDTLAIHNGADDNASGVAAILEVAEKLAARPHQLKRSVLFVAFDGEEMGRLGSTWFVRNPLVPLQNIEIMLNMDMIGRLDSLNKVLTVSGTGTAMALENIVLKCATKSGITINASPEGYGPSDHASFYIEDIPVLMFFTGAHNDYHTPFDDADRIHYTGLKNISELVYDLVCELGNRESRLIFTEAGPKAGATVRRRFNVTLGIVPDHASTDVQGLRVDGVIKDRPACIAGMKKGDIIVALDGKSVNNIYDYMNRLSDFKAGQRISVEIVRAGEKQILIVEL